MGVPIIGQGNNDLNAGPVLRILYCYVCDSIEELPPFFGRPENDHLLAVSLEKHVFPSGEEHKGRLYVFPEAYWNGQTKKDIIDQIRGRAGAKGLASADPTYYDTKNTFMEDALTCFSRHGRPEDGCSDYQSPAKRLLPKTAEERKELGLPSPKDAPGPRSYLCNFCPVHSQVTTRKRALLGMYK